MFKTRTLYLLTALLLSVAAIEPSSADSLAKLSLGRDLPSLASAQDYWSASKSSLRLANQHRLHNETAAACEELANSFDYYRMALAKETNMPLRQFGTGLGDDEGVREIRAMFGCSSATV